MSSIQRDFWTKRCLQSSYHGPWTNAVERCGITLKALTYRPSGGIVAAPATSLPERIGGPLNWDYRYCWLRDSSPSKVAHKLYEFVSAGKLKSA